MLMLTSKYRRKPLTIWLNTEGGYAQQSMEVCSMIKAHGAVTIIAFGECMSAGIDLLCAAHTAKSTSMCEFMLHRGSQTNETNYDEKKHKKQLKFTKTLINQKVNVTKSTVTKWLNKDTYMDAERALKVGLIDEIIS